MSTLIPPDNPDNPDNPVQPSPDDDQTGVRALLSALPEPGPMPAYLVERISASLAAEQAQRAHSSVSSPVTPMLTTRRRPGRRLFAIAGAAAAAVLIGVLGNNALTPGQTTASGGVAASDTASGTREAGGAAPNPSSATPPSANAKSVPGSTVTPASIQIRVSNVRYTDATFVAQARALRDVLFDSPLPMTADSSTLGPNRSVDGLVNCLSALDAAGAQMVQADLAFYEGQPAVIIVATRDGIPTAYVVGRECTRTQPHVLRPATTLP